MSGQGFTSVAIARALADGTLPGTIRVQLQRAGLSKAQGTVMPLRLSTYELTRLDAFARDRGMDPPDWLREVIRAILTNPNDMYDAIVDP